MSDTLTVPRFNSRAAVIDRAEDGKVKAMSVASNAPYKRYDWEEDEYYFEVLSHDPADIDQERLMAGLPVCFNHDRDKPLATAGKYRIENGKLLLDYDDFKWTAGEFTENKRKDIESGALPFTSVTYEITGDGKQIGTRDGLRVYQFPWKPYEGGPVVIPADSSVGYGKRGEKPTFETRQIQVDKTNNPSEKQTTNTPMSTPANPADPKQLTAEDMTRAANEAAEKAIAAKQKRDDDIDAFVDALSNPEWKAEADKVARAHKRNPKSSFDDFRAEAFGKFKTSGSVDPEPEQQRGAFDFEVVGERQVKAKIMTSPGFEFTRAQGFVNFQKNYPRGSFRQETKGSYLMRRTFQAMQMQRAGFTSSDLASVNLTVSQNLLPAMVQRLTILDLIAPGTMDTQGFVYPVERNFDPFADVAQEVPERGLKPEWEPEFTTDRADASVIAVMATVPRQFLADFSAFQSFLDNRLEYLLGIKAEKSVLYGDGLNGNIKGIFSTQGVLTRAYGTVAAETTPDAFFRGNTDIETSSYFDVDGFAMHPYDWEQIRLLKDANGQYIGGGPFYAPYGNGMVVKFNTLWNLPCVVTKSVKLGRPLAGAWKLGAQYFMRQGMTIETSNSHKDYFQRNLLAVLAEERMALATYYPQAFLEHTGFPGRA